MSVTSSHTCPNCSSACWYLWSTLYPAVIVFFGPDSWGCICVWPAGWRGGRWDTRPASHRSDVETIMWVWFSTETLWTRAANTTLTATGSKVLWQHNLYVQTQAGLWKYIPVCFVSGDFSFWTVCVVKCFNLLLLNLLLHQRALCGFSSDTQRLFVLVL